MFCFRSSSKDGGATLLIASPRGRGSELPAITKVVGCRGAANTLSLPKLNIFGTKRVHCRRDFLGHPTCGLRAFGERLKLFRANRSAFIQKGKIVVFYRACAFTGTIGMNKWQFGPVDHGADYVTWIAGQLRHLTKLVGRKSIFFEDGTSTQRARLPARLASFLADEMPGVCRRRGTWRRKLVQPNGAAGHAVNTCAGRAASLNRLPVRTLPYMEVSRVARFSGAI